MPTDTNMSGKVQPKAIIFEKRCYYNISLVFLSTYDRYARYIKCFAFFTRRAFDKKQR